MEKAKTTKVTPTEVNCLQYAGDRPAYDLAGNKVVYGVTLPSKRSYFVHMKPCTDQKRLKALYEKVGGAVLKAASGDNVDLLGTDKSSCIPFFARYFDIMTNAKNNPIKSPGTKEEQLEWMGNHPKMELEQTVVMSGMLSLDIEDNEDEIVDDDVADLSIEEESVIKTINRVVDLDTLEVVEIPITWSLRDVSEHEHRRWQKATGQTRMHTKKWTFQRKVDHAVVESLFKSLVYNAEGCLINSVACIESNVDKWAGLVNYGWMYLIMNHVFRGSAIKNE